MKKSVLLILIPLFFILGSATAEEETNQEILGETQYQIEILVHSCQLVLIRNGDEKSARVYPAATARADNLIPLNEKGEAEKIIFNPPWRPTPNIRKRYFKKHGKELPEYIPPVVQANALGRIALELSFIMKEGKVLKIHDTNEPRSVGKRVSSGCTRMYYNDIEEIVTAILSESRGVNKETARRIIREAVATKKIVEIKLDKGKVVVIYKAS